MWKITAYNPTVEQTDSTPFITASGRIIAPLQIAVDPRYWRLGTRFYISGIGEVIATDTGSAIKGSKRADVVFMSKALARQWGVKYREVFLLEETVTQAE